MLGEMSLEETIEADGAKGVPVREVRVPSVPQDTFSFRESLALSEGYLTVP